MNQPNAITIQKYLKGVDYPCDKSTLVEHAQSQGADGEALKALEQIPDRTYDGPNAVSKAIGA
nr:DUF2795 domain-containing protein [Kibdelosporangium persicum]